MGLFKFGGEMKSKLLTNDKYFPKLVGLNPTPPYFHPLKLRELEFRGSYFMGKDFN